MSHDELSPDQPSQDTSPSNARPTFQRAATAPWPSRAPSTESLPHMNHRTPASSAPPLRKRHSTFTLSQNQQHDLNSSPLHSLHPLPPLRPPRNPARAGSVPPESPQLRAKSGSRPSTATSTKSREDVDHHDIRHEERKHYRSGAPSIKSHASSGLTGPIEEVTPWELEPVPPMPLPTRDTTVQMIRPTREVATETTTGPIEVVTPWELYPAVIPERLPDAPVSSRSSQAPPPATGRTEDVTPWELYPAPIDDDEKDNDKSSIKGGFLNSTGPRSSLTMSKAQIEDVTPWELYPAPATAPEKAKEEDLANGIVKKKNSRSSTRPSSSSGSSKALAEFGFVRRRRSTDSKSVKSRSSHPHTSNGTMTSSKHPVSSSTFKSHSPSIHSHSETSPRTSPTTPRFGLTATAAASLPAPVPTPSTSRYKYAPSGSSNTSESQQHRSLNEDLKFSTADRTVLEGLKRIINARAAQFVIRGKGCRLLGGDISPGKKYHAYPREEVPYPRSYDREVVDLDVWETLFCQDTCRSLTWHVFEKPPTRVLDIGCGTGTWILNCARTWKECQFVGLDIVPIQPDLQQVGSPDLASRITWVQANFLDSLPFPKDEFDYVHIKRIALGVPENNWNTLFAEIDRVMKPGGAIEIIEEDLFFPGHSAENDDDSNTGSDAATTMSRRSSITSNGDYHIPSSQMPEDASISRDLRTSEDDAPPTPKSSIPELPSGASHPNSSNTTTSLESPSLSNNALFTVPDSLASVSPKGSPRSSQSPFLILPHSRSAARPLLQVKTTSSPYNRPISQKIAGSAVSLMSSMGYVPPQTPPPLPQIDINQVTSRRRSSSIITPSTEPPSASTENSFGTFNTDTSSLIIPRDTPHAAGGSNRGQQSARNSLDHLQPETPPPNPRDHTVIETIYKEMLASRFINNSPISVIGTYLEFYFKDVRTHPPLLYSFPPPIHPHAKDNHQDRLDDDSDDARDAIIPNVEKAWSTKSIKSGKSGRYLQKDSLEASEEKQILTMEDLFKHSSPYVALDVSRGYAFAPKSSAHGRIAAEKGAGHELTRMPNTHFHFDLRTLHLHLALRTREVLACSESMWEWVLEHQAQLRAHQSGGRAGSPEVLHRTSGSVLSHPRDESDISIDNMTRSDFDNLLGNFDIDMRDQAGLVGALEKQFAWSTISDENPDRKAFNKACEKYDKWALAHLENRSSHSREQYQLHSSASHIVQEDQSQHIPRRQSKDVVNGSNSHGTYAASGSSVHSSSFPPAQRLSRAMRVFAGWKREI